MSDFRVALQNSDVVDSSMVKNGLHSVSKHRYFTFKSVISDSCQPSLFLVFLNYLSTGLLI